MALRDHACYTHYKREVAYSHSSHGLENTKQGPNLSGGVKEHESIPVVHPNEINLKICIPGRGRADPACTLHHNS